ncbi:hypothetical protein ES288_D13G119600v1 [Gossypium darwinii]|uniref:DUF668 domain-containing protein n=1 Tax=Gossypium darwinii TaxID=34276 RepID=A0A5D2A0J5_GOSDA|nr:hypothetical protein ES288_D13G119600v1 [Gossypium darwinii]
MSYHTSQLRTTIVESMAWLSAAVDKAGGPFSPNKSTLQILAFEAVKAMSRLVALYKYLSDDELFKLRKGPMKSLGVAFLNSMDESYLLGLACKEKLEDLGHAVVVVSRLSKQCIDVGSKFEIAYHNKKQGIIDVGNVDFNSRNVGKAIEKMEKYANATSALHASLVALNELEFLHFRKISLWSQTFDTSVGLMARIVFVIYARICTIFGPFVPSLTCIYIPKRKALHKKVYPETSYCLLVDKEKYTEHASKSGPIMKASRTNPRPRRSHSGQLCLSGPIMKASRTEPKNKSLIQSAPGNTVGAAGLALHYANIIIMAESCFYSTTSISNESQENMYEMLPISLKHALRRKLKGHLSKDVEESDEGQGLAQGWKEALGEIIGWLAPVAHDTLRWQQESDSQQQKLDSEPTALLMQTLHFSELEKTEAAIVEVLVGLSCIYRYGGRRERLDG